MNPGQWTGLGIGTIWTAFACLIGAGSVLGARKNKMSLYRYWTVGMYNELKDLRGVVALHVLLLPFAVPMYLSALVYYPAKFAVARVCSLVSFSKGVSTVKRKVIVGLVLMLLGYGTPAMFDGVTAWYKAPPTPPRAEAQKLITSLEAGDGWIMDGNYVKRGDVKVYANSFLWSDVWVGDTKTNNAFTVSELKSIGKAAEACQRRLITSTLETASKNPTATAQK